MDGFSRRQAVCRLATIGLWRLLVRVLFLVSRRQPPVIPAFAKQLARIRRLRHRQDLAGTGDGGTARARPPTTVPRLLQRPRLALLRLLPRTASGRDGAAAVRPWPGIEKTLLNSCRYVQNAGNVTRMREEIDDGGMRQRHRGRVAQRMSLH